MKNFLLALMLIVVTGQDVALGKGIKNRLPRLVEVSLPEMARLHAGSPLLTKPLAVLPIAALEESVRAELHRDKRKHVRSATTVGAGGMLAASIYGLFFVFSKPMEDSSLISPEGLAFMSASIIASGLMVEAIKKMDELGTVKDVSKIVGETTANENNIVIYSYDGKYHIGLLSNTREDFTVVDPSGNERSIEHEQLLQLVTIRDGLLSHRFSFKRSGKPCNLYSDVPNCYQGKTMAFKYQDKNHLGTIEVVRFAADGQGSFVVATAAGEELTITRGERGEPVVVDPHTGEQSKDQFRGVIFLPF